MYHPLMSNLGWNNADASVTLRWTTGARILFEPDCFLCVFLFCCCEVKATRWSQTEHCLMIKLSFGHCLLVPRWLQFTPLKVLPFGVRARQEIYKWRHSFDLLLSAAPLSEIIITSIFSSLRAGGPPILILRNVEPAIFHSSCSI